VQSAVLVLGSINRLTSATEGYVASNEFLRWVDLFNLLAIPLLSLGALYLLKRTIEYRNDSFDTSRHVALSLMFVLGVYVVGASYGVHEVTNYFNTRFCPDEDASALCRVVVYNDDQFSHFVFFTGFLMVNGSLLLLETLFPHEGGLSRRDIVLLLLNAVFVAAAIFANLAFEPTGFDIFVVATLAALAVALLWRRGQQPLALYYSAGYVAGLIATAVKSVAD
jgi:hypothetical protein